MPKRNRHTTALPNKTAKARRNFANGGYTTPNKHAEPVLELSESTVDTKQLIRIQMSGDSSHVESHMRLWGKFPNEEYHLFRPLPK